MNLYQFKIHYYVDYEDKEFDECGLIIAEDYIDAIKKINETFGSYIDEIFIKEKGINHSVVVIPDNLMEDILEVNDW